MNDHHGDPDEADRGRRQRPDHLLTHLAPEQVGFALLVSHLAKASEGSIDRFTKSVNALSVDRGL
jgi:hypothetical protein